MSNHGQFKQGIVSTTDMQFKKHVTQMKPKELVTIIKRVKEVPKLELSGHVIKKIMNDGLDFQLVSIVAVLKGLEASNVIEYNVTLLNNGQKSTRVLLRSTEEYPVEIKGKSVVCNLCFSLSLDNGSVVTVYWNEAKDEHKELDWSRYQGNLKVV